MPKILSIKETIDSNPSVDPKLLNRFRKALRKLRQAGTERKGYGLASPINRRRASISRDKNNDSRTIHLGSRH